MEGKSKPVVFIICSNSVHPAGKTNKQPKPKVLPSAATGQTADPPQAQLPPSPDLLLQLLRYCSDLFSSLCVVS